MNADTDGLIRRLAGKLEPVCTPTAASVDQDGDVACAFRSFCSRRRISNEAATRPRVEIVRGALRY
jgi:hypothetical protein